MRIRIAACRVIALGALALTAVGGAGCADDFDPYNRLTSLRVLAIKSDPTASVAPGETVTLTPALFAMPGDVPDMMTWKWCPFPGPSSNGYDCLISYDELVALTGGAFPIPPYDLPAGPTTTFTNDFPPALLEQICLGPPGIPELPDCEGGLPIQIEFFVSSPLDRMVVAEPIKTVRTLRLRFDSTLVPFSNVANANPTQHGELVALINGTPMPIPDIDGVEPTVTLPRDRETAIRLEGLTEEAAESYQGFDDEEQPATLRERLTLTWFVESGDPKENITGFIEDIEPIEDAQLNGWTPAIVKDYPGDTARIVVVIRDNRGGVDWVRGKVKLENMP